MSGMVEGRRVVSIRCQRVISRGRRVNSWGDACVAPTDSRLQVLIKHSNHPVRLRIGVG